MLADVFLVFLHLFGKLNIPPMWRIMLPPNRVWSFSQYFLQHQNSNGKIVCNSRLSKTPNKIQPKKSLVTRIFIIFIYEIRVKDLLKKKKSLVSLNISGSAEIFVLRYQNWSRDHPKVISRYAYAGNEERGKYSSKPFPTRYEKEVGGRLQPLYPHERNGTLCAGGWVILGSVWTALKISPAPGFDPPTVPPQASRCAHRYLEACLKFSLQERLLH
jgi:hypothetical protein